METLHVDRGYSKVNNRVVGLVWSGATLIDRYLHFRRNALCGETLPIKRSIRQEFWQLNIVMEMLSCF